MTSLLLLLLPLVHGFSHSNPFFPPLPVYDDARKVERPFHSSESDPASHAVLDRAALDRPIHFPPPPTQQPNASHILLNSYNVIEEDSPICGEVEQQRIKQCAQPLYELGAFDSFDGSLSLLDFSWTRLASKTKDYFSQVCEHFFVFDLCIEPWKDACFEDEPIRMKYRTASQVLEFLCRDGYSEMMRNFECFTRTLTRAEMMQCQAEMVADTRKIPERAELEPISQQQAVCGAMRNYIECVKYPVRYECGYRAWHLVREVIVRPTASLLPYCDLGSSAGGVSAIVAVIVALLML